LILRSGIDLVEIERLERMDPSVHARFCARIYTQAELDESKGLPSYLAGRFAAKEAVAKALGCGIGPVSWREIEIRGGPAGEPCLFLYGEAQRMADELGVTQWSVSITHTRAHAVAMVVALGEGAKDGVDTQDSGGTEMGAGALSDDSVIDGLVE
jgi:holo-[acyl-carrier protein] synthase